MRPHTHPDPSSNAPNEVQDGSRPDLDPLEDDDEDAGMDSLLIGTPPAPLVP